MTAPFKLMGDPHLGRAFLNDVPLHRRGEREQMQWADFARRLDPEGAPFHICMGDLFDKPVVPPAVVLTAALGYIGAAREHPSTEFYVIRGNHDASRDLQATTSFDLFQHLVSRESNITVVYGVVHIPAIKACLFGWQPIEPAAEYVTGALGEGATGVEIVFGHWDTDPRSDPHNLIPTRQLADAGVQRAYTGHVHKPSEFTRDGVEVTVVGSMQPYAHGEQINEDIYVTLTLAELAEHDVTNKCVRVVLEPGEIIETVPNCLQFKTLRKEDTSELPEIEIGSFNLLERFSGVLVEHDVPENIAEKVKAKWNDTFA